ncbi:uncharacterized protein LOC128172972 [Crassostrea angulata]|uniref:uncharacterized protein LOC128172972 n=1 Tax=Magallana angulata TaxID=2784310 RepID=UPI0022B0BF4D|nr:uncharacterized protein LOC128172972 [Crassostrea angulata]
MEKMDRGLISDELRKLLLSFSVDIPDDASGNSFVRDVLDDFFVHNFVSDTRSLSHGVVLTRDLFPKEETFKRFPPTVHVLEVNIDSDPETWEEKRDSLKLFLLLLEKENLVKLILVHSDSMGIIDAKLRVYQKYRGYIEAYNIYLQHVYEEFDEIVQSIAYKNVSYFEEFVGAMIEAFSKESLEAVIIEAIDMSLIEDNIAKLCYEVSIEYKNDIVGTVKTGSYNCYSAFTVRAIKQILVKETLKKTAKSLAAAIRPGIVHHIESVVQKTLVQKLGDVVCDMSGIGLVYNRMQFPFTTTFRFLLNILSGWIENIVIFVIRIFHPVDINSKEWRGKVAEEIYQKILERRQKILALALEEILNICWQTTEDLKDIQHRLKEFKRKVLPSDQKQIIKEWLKRDVLQDKKALENHPSIMQYIAGHRLDGQPVVKVFLRDNDKDAQIDFKNACYDLEDTELEFVNVAEKSMEIQRQAEKMKLCERNAPAIDKKTRNEIKQVIQEHGGKIYATYSNVVGMRIGKVRSVGDEIEDNPCIVLYCLDKNLIPFGEKPLPKTIAGCPCDIREDYVMFGHCPNRCPASRQNLPEPGCSIGIPSVDSSGSVGFLVEPKNPTEQFRCGFLTASHVAVKRFKELNHHKSLLSMSHLSLEEHPIVHPSWQDNGHMDNAVGQVVESFCGNYGLCQTGLDFALVRIHGCREEEKEALPIVNDEELDFDGETKVTKSGRTTGTTIGDLTDDSLTVRVDTSFLSRGYIAFFNCYAVENITEQNAFFRQGDSGSGVYVMEKDETLKPLGIAFASLFSQTAVCKIDSIIQKLDLKIVRYLDNKQTQLLMSQTGNVTEEKLPEQEPMDCV